MDRVLRWGIRLVAALAVLTALAAVAAYGLATRSLPPLDGVRRVAGPDRPIEIVRDAYGVPRIFAETERDAYFGLGFVHAVDRLWQMDVLRRTAQGRLAERFGRRALSSDLMLRALDLSGHAERAYAGLSERSRAALDAYAEGVNARIRMTREERLGRGAPEFLVFGGGPELWRPEDSVAVLKTMALRLSVASLLRETQRGKFLLTLEPRQVRDLFPDYPGPGVQAIPARTERAERRPMRRAELAGPTAETALSFLGLNNSRLGAASNAWAVDGERSASRAPLVASDPHLGLSAPSIWHPAQISAPGLKVIGATIPGLPAFPVGRNDRVAWAPTAAQLDDMDVFIERLDPQDPGRYAGPDGWLAFETREELVQVRGSGAVSATLRRSRHGPILPLDAAGLSAVTPEGHVPALAWTALTDDDASMDALIGLNRARDLRGAIRAANDHVAPALNLILADSEDIGMMLAGRAPLRRLTTPIQGRAPSPGWTDAHDWVGWLPRGDFPLVIDPPGGALANANNRVGELVFPRHLSFDWDAPYRLHRIEKALNGAKAHSLQIFQSYQLDDGSEMARALAPLIGRSLWGAEPDPDAHPLRAKALALLKDWDGAMSAHRSEPLIFSAWVNALTEAVAGDELGPLIEDYRGPRPLFLERVFRDLEGAAIWCDVAQTPERESCADMARLALDRALEQLSARYGRDPAAWRWGAAHRALHRHEALGALDVSVLGLRIGPGPLVNIEHESGGGDFTLNRGVSPHRGPEPFANIHAAGYRGVYDFADLDRSAFIVATGASGHPLSPYYANLTPLWRVGEYMPMSMSRADFQAGAIGVLVLEPKPKDP